jgi:hypothetical protein
MDAGLSSLGTQEKISEIFVKSGNAIDACLIFLLTVGLQALRAQLVRPGRKLGPLALVLQQGNSVPAGIRNAGDLHQNDGSGSFVLGESSGEIRKFRVAPLDHPSPPVQTDNFWRSLKRAEHQDDSPVLFQMRDRLDPAAGQVQVSDGIRPQNSKGVESLRRDIHVAAGIERRRSDEEERLGFNEFPDGIVDR